MDEEREMPESHSSHAADAARAAARVGSEAAKSYAKKSISAAASNAVRSFLLPILPWILLVVVILIVVVGIIMFFISGMGLIYDSLDSFASGFKEYVADMWYGSDQNVKPYEIIQVADKLESMGYDLFGEGFVTESVRDNGDSLYGDGVVEYRKKINKPIDEDNVKVDSSGIARDEYGITNINSYLLRRYLISDNYVYTLYNNNSSWHDFFMGVPATDGFLLPRKGLIRLVLEQGGVFGSFGGVFNQMSYNGLFGKVYRSTMSLGTDTIVASVDIGANTLNIGTERGILWWKKTDTLSYNLEGWTGRYGMPLEFLLGMHLASEQPDLVMDMLDTFQTHVNVGLHPTTAHFVSGIEISGHIVTLDDLNDLGSAEEFMKTYYPEHYKKWLAEQQSETGTEETKDTEKTTETEETEEEGENPDNPDTTESPESPDTTEDELTEEEKQELLKDIIEDSDESVEGPDGKKLYKVPADSQVGNADYVFIDDEGYIYYPNAEGKYEKSNDKYDPTKARPEIEITDEDEDMLDFDTIKKVLQQAAGGNASGKDDFDTFLPYIRNVSNHWFRDAYFVLGTDSQFDDTEQKDPTVRLIKNDKEFEQKVGERWTMYERDENGNYTLYKVNDDGSIGDRYPGTQEQAAQEGTRVTKKAITQLVSEKIAEGDEIFNEGIQGSIWSAYDVDGASIQVDWTQWDEKARDFPAGATDEIKAKLKYQITIDDQITQKRDGERTATNPQIKKMLTRYKYYSYDGSIDRAKEIAADRDKNKDYKHEDENGTIIDGTKDDPRNQNLVGKFLINAESESAFKIMDNMNTLDADYIYRDLKELIVELNYYDKEDLAGNDTGVFQWPLPDTGTIGWPVREFSKIPNEFGTLIHSKVDLKNLYDIYSLSSKTEGQGGGPSAPDEEKEEGEKTAAIQNESTSLMAQMFIEQKESIISTQGKASNKMDGAGSGFGQSTFFDTAQECWNYISDHGSEISYGALGACPFATPGGGHKGTIDCSGFVTWVIYEWGTGEIKSHFSSQRATPALMSDNYTDLFGWVEIDLGPGESARDKLQPGDILVRDNGGGGSSGHTAIVKEVSGDVIGWDCGNASHWATPCEDTTIGAGFVDGDGRKGKIIRIEDAPEPPEKYKGYEGNTDVVSPVTGEIVEAGKTIVEKKNLETNEKEEVGYIKIKVMTTEDLEAIKPPKVENIKDLSDLKENEKKYAGIRYFYDEYEAAGVLGMYVYIEGFDVRIVDEALNLQNDSTIEEDGEYRSRYRKHTFESVIGDETRKVLKNKERLRDMALSTFPCDVNGKTRIFVKEGTVLGKTYTDGALEEEPSDEALVDADRAVVRPCVAAGFSEKYPDLMFSSGKKVNWDEIEDDKKPTGNYIKVIVRTAEDGQAKENPKAENVSNNTDKDNVIEDCEDYFELDKPVIDDECPMKLQTTDIPRDIWVQCVVEYSSNRASDAIFTDPEAMGEFYDICVQHEMNPDFLFTRAVAETGLQNSNNNYWGWGVANGKADENWGSWKATLMRVCDGIVGDYATPGGAQYGKILERYEERKAVKENGGIPRFGYGQPDTVPGVMSVYSWLGNEHIEGDSSKGGRYYLDPDHSEIYTHENYNSLCVGPHGSGPTTVWEQGSYTANQVRGMLNTAHNVWEQYYPEEFHNELWY